MADEVNEEEKFGRMGETHPIWIAVFVESEVPVETYMRIDQLNKKHGKSIVRIQYKDKNGPLFKTFNVSSCPTILLLGYTERVFSSPTVVMKKSQDFEDIFNWAKEYKHFRTDHAIFL